MPFNLRGPEILILLFVLLVIVGVIVLVIFLIKALSRPSAPSPTTTARPPGWYPVPVGTGRVAWWDGQKWDDSVTPPSSGGGSP